VFTLGLGLVNTNGLIADYNVERYLSGQTKIIDIDTLAFLDDAALPALYRLQEDGLDAKTREDAASAIERIRDPYASMSLWRDQQDQQYAWSEWNLRSLEAARLDE
jgi:hypothetical protein